MKLDWGKSIFIFFVIFLSLAFTFIAFSFKHKNDLVVDDYYEQGAAYTKQIEINKRSAVYTDSIHISNFENGLKFQFCKSIAENADSVTIYFYYPASKEYDKTFTYNEVSDTLKISSDSFVKGRTQIKMSWRMNGNSFYLEKDFFLN